MQNIQKGLGLTITNLSDQNYEKSLTYFRFWFEVGHTHLQLHADQIFDMIYEGRASGLSNYASVYPKTALILRLINSLESDPTLAPECAGFRNLFCYKILQNFFDNDMGAVLSNSSYNAVPNGYYADVNYVAHCANFGYMEETTIRNHILQSLVSHTRMLEHQVTALAILFKIAGATFEAYADPAVVNRCFEIFNDNQYYYWGREMVRASAFSVWKRFRN